MVSRINLHLAFLDSRKFLRVAEKRRRGRTAPVRRRNHHKNVRDWIQLPRGHVVVCEGERTAGDIRFYSQEAKSPGGKLNITRVLKY